MIVRCTERKERCRRGLGDSRAWEGPRREGSGQSRALDTKAVLEYDD